VTGGDTRYTSKADGFAFGAYHVQPEGRRRGGLVLIQEIFGVNENIRALADSFAGEGFEVIAPSLYDRIQPGFTAAYDEAGIAAAREIAQAAAWETVVGDVQACIDALEPPVFAAGFCWGGSATWVAACRCEGLSAASAFYGRLIPQFLDEEPRCPIILHFGARDTTIPMSDVETIRAAKPPVPVYVYEAGHGFFSDRRADYDAEASGLARRRMLDFLAEHGAA
jgi:carboxymethylenebutenolidase